MRVTGEEVKAIIETELDENQILPYITTSNVYVNQMLGITDLSENVLSQIELWFTAHLIATTKERISKKEEAGSAKVEYVGSFGMGLTSTPYGQACLNLDTSGELAKESKQNIKFIVPKE